MKLKKIGGIDPGEGNLGVSIVNVEKRTTTMYIINLKRFTTCIKVTPKDLPSMVEQFVLAYKDVLLTIQVIGIEKQVISKARIKLIARLLYNNGKKKSSARHRTSSISSTKS